VFKTPQAFLAQKNNIYRENPTSIENSEKIQERSGRNLVINFCIKANDMW